MGGKINMSCAEPSPPISDKNKSKYGIDMATPTVISLHELRKKQ